MKTEGKDTFTIESSWGTAKFHRYRIEGLPETMDVELLTFEGKSVLKVRSENMEIFRQLGKWLSTKPKRSEP